MRRDDDRRTWRTRAALSVLGLASMPVLAGCGSPQDDAVRTVVDQFTGAVAAEDGTAACRLLAPRTKSELEQSTSKPCAQALLEEDVPGRPENQPVGELEVYGTAAWMRTSADTLFLARFQGGWKVSAAGCTRATSATPRMYDCVVKGG